MKLFLIQIIPIIIVWALIGLIWPFKMIIEGGPVLISCAIFVSIVLGRYIGYLLGKENW